MNDWPTANIPKQQIKPQIVWWVSSKFTFNNSVLGISAFNSSVTGNVALKVHANDAFLFSHTNTPENKSCTRWMVGGWYGEDKSVVHFTEQIYNNSIAMVYEREWNDRTHILVYEWHGLAVWLSTMNGAGWVLEWHVCVCVCVWVSTGQYYQSSVSWHRTNKHKHEYIHTPD